MNFVARLALRVNERPIVDSLAEAVSMHQWTRGLGGGIDAASKARREVMRHGLLFVMRRGADTYGCWIKKSAELRAQSVDGWFDAIDRTKGLILLEQDEIESVRFGAARVPAPLATVRDYAARFERLCTVVVEFKPKVAHQE